MILANGSDADAESLAAATAEIFRAFGNPKVTPADAQPKTRASLPPSPRAGGSPP